MKLKIKAKTFDEILKDCQLACQHLIADIDSELIEEYVNLARDFKTTIEWIPIRGIVFKRILKRLTIHLPIEIEKRLINIYPKLNDEERAKVKTLIDGFLDKAKINYYNQLKILYAKEGKINWEPPKTLNHRINSDVHSYKNRAYGKIEDAINSRISQYHIQKKAEIKMMITGFLFGIVASVIAGLILM
jgi:hypothetical protein